MQKNFIMLATLVSLVIFLLVDFSSVEVFYSYKEFCNYFVPFLIFVGILYVVKEISVQDEIRKVRILLEDRELSEKEKSAILMEKVRKNLTMDLSSKNLGYVLVIACETGNFRIARELIGYGLPVNEKYCDNTALMHAVRKGNKEIINCLLENGADPKIANRYGDTVLDIAQKANNQELVSFLTYLSR